MKIILEALKKYQETAIKQKESGPLQALEDLVPSNIFEAATSNRNMLQVIFFAVFFWNWFNIDTRGKRGDRKEIF